MRHPHALVKISASLAGAMAVLASLCGAVGPGPVAAAASSAPVAAASAPAGTGPGYWLVGANGEVFQAGTTNYGDMRGHNLTSPVVGGASSPDGRGYWLVASDGGIFTFGSAVFRGSTGAIRLNRPIVGMAADPGTGGYWLVASDGGLFAFGGAGFYGSTGAIHLNKPVVGMAATPSGHGYWLVASDGGIFAFGDARFHGSTGAMHLNRPVVGMAADPATGGYWLVASDGGIFSFDAAYHGSTGGIRLNSPIVAMGATPSGGGYWLAAGDGGVFAFNAPYLGAAGTNGSPPIVSFMSTANGFPFPPGATGYDVSQYQCPYYPGHVSGLPPTRTAVAIVQVSGGAINHAQPPSCYPAEAAWAGPNMSTYIFMDGLPSPPPKESMTGPAGNCATTNALCQSYNFGYYWAQYWVRYAHDAGTHPTLWWLDVETAGAWSGSQSSNAQVIAGGVAGLHASGVTPGIYSTNYQWGVLTGYQVSFPHIPLWVPGAAGTAQAQSFCTNPPAAYQPFAGGTTVLIQDSYTTPRPLYDEDYACR
jgi:hypothetical protein